MLLAYNLFTTAGTLCCAAFYTIVQGLNLNAFSFLLYFISCAAQFYTVCHYGQWMMDLVINTHYKYIFDTFTLIFIFV